MAFFIIPNSNLPSNDWVVHGDGSLGPATHPGTNTVQNDFDGNGNVSSEEAMVDSIIQRQEDANIAAWEREQSSAEKMMQFQRDINDLNWQRQMHASNTAYQRQVADLRKAGLNPILALTHGGGASTPSATSASGAMASGNNTSVNADSLVNILNTQVSSSASIANGAMGLIAMLGSVLLDKFLPGSGKVVRAIGFSSNWSK